MAPRRRSVTIGHVARAAGVGTGTVSRVLNQDPNVSTRTRARVLEIMRRFEYRPHAGARTLARNASRTVGFVMANRQSMHLYNVATLNGVMSSCVARGYSVIYTHFDYRQNAAADEIALPPIVLERGGIDGVVLVGINHRNVLDRLAHLHVPFVLHHSGFSGSLDGVEGGDVVSMDDMGGIDRGTTHLVNLGHRRICFIGDVKLPWFRRRLAGYRAALSRARLRPQTVWVEGGGDNFDAGARSVEALLQKGSGCTAIVAGDDLVMLGVLDALRARGISVPGQVSLLGFGDTQEIRYQQTPALSTIRAPRFEMGEQMGELLLSRLQDRARPPRSVVLPTELVLRDSCGPSPAARRT
jgi:DNA-binding LacI/PurR family transcriptional regulator